MKHLLLGQNAFGDAGIIQILEYLCTEKGRKLPIEEVSLNVTGMGDAALDSLSKYLTDNQTLVGLHLPHVRLN